MSWLWFQNNLLAPVTVGFIIAAATWLMQSRKSTKSITEKGFTEKLSALKDDIVAKFVEFEEKIEQQISKVNEKNEASHEKIYNRLNAVEGAQKAQDERINNIAHEMERLRDAHEKNMQGGGHL